METPLRLEDITIRNELHAGDIGYVVYLHGTLYKAEYDYGIEFESYVAKGLHDFIERYSPDRDHVWICEHITQIIGFMLLMDRGGNSAQLRFFILTPGYRGIGLGKKLMNEFMQLLKKKNYHHAFLWTTNEQEAAAYLYRKAGFTVTQEKNSTAFGKPLIEQRYEVYL
ncbi:MAG TPA: GNAT family N-acetyltransferase [Flavitalea sp.]|nr:GNAT family N-acetyltransferase [Flavitalea sp.]